MAAPFGNLFALGADSGRPPRYETAEDMRKKLIEYLEYIQGEKGTDVGKDGQLEEWKRPPENITITGLCLYLGFESRQSFYDYEKREEFSYLIKRARLLVENRHEQGLSGQYVTGHIFALKNMGWVDKVESGFTDKDGKDITRPPAIMVVRSKTDDEFEIKESEE